MLRESFRMAIEAIRANKLRSTLTLLGITIGVFSVIGVMTAIRTMEVSIESGLNIFGSNTFNIQKYPAIQMGGHTRNKYRNRKNITYDNFTKLKERATLPLMVSANDVTAGMPVKYKDNETKRNIAIVGGDEGTLRLYNTNIAEGRNLISQDVEFHRNIVVLGMDAVDQLFPFEDPVGKEISIGGLKYSVIGYTEKVGEMFGQSQDNYVLIPLTVFLQRYSSFWRSLDIAVEAPSAELYDKTQDEVIGILRMIRGVPPGEENDFEVVTNDQLIATFGQFTSGVKLFAFAISIIALLVAGIGIMNIMLVSVTERIKEIGIRKAVGATRSDIMLQFLAEAVFLSLFGGVAGVILGLLGGNSITLLMDIDAQIPVFWVVFGLLVCSMIGIVFGIYPANRASKLDPIDSLRYE